MTSDSEGYLHERYAEALAGFGRPRCLERSGAWVLERQIPGSALKDGMGCYPLFCCRNWAGLAEDMEDLSDLVSLVAVTDPFGTHDLSLLRQCFPDLTKPFKHHYVTDLTHNPDEFLSPHHKRNIKKSLASVDVEKCDRPARYGEIWVALYNQLTLRHAISGISAFSPNSLRKQLTVPGLEMFRAVLAGETLGIVLWVVQNNIAYYHLGAYSDVGYQTRCSYAIFWLALQEFARRGLHWLSLGSSAGMDEDETDGLARFKKGWSTGSKTAYLCGRVLNREGYKRLLRDPNARTRNYFPQYREREFG